MIYAIHLLMQAMLMAAFALGLWAAMGQGMILAALGRLADRLPKWLAMPLGTCPRCMCGFWGVVALLVFGFGVGIEINLSGHRLISDGFGGFTIVWERLREIPALIIVAVGLQELFHRN